MGSPTKVVENIRGNKRNKRLNLRQRRLKKELAKEAKNTPAELRQFIPGIQK